VATSGASRAPTTSHEGARLTATSVTRRLAWGLLAFLSVGVGVYAFAFYFVAAVGDPTFKARFATMPLFAAFHVLGAGAALVIGPLQLSRTMRTRALNVHRWLGRAYLTAVMLGGLGGLMLATIAAGGLVGRVGFAFLAVIWLGSGAQAYLAVRRGDLVAHRQWMIRNFSLTFAAVTLRIHLPVLTGGFGVPFDDAYATVAWLAWVPNLVIAEWFVLPTRSSIQEDAGLARASQRSSAFAND
jgi:uncharacterized membrane protein